MIKVQFEQLRDVPADIEYPKYMSRGAYGMDLRAFIDTEKVELRAGTTVYIPTGISIKVLEPGWAPVIIPRSSSAKLGYYMSNTIGLVDADYRGELFVPLSTRKVLSFVEQYERIAQLVFVQVACAEFLKVTDIGNTARGAGGFGSTGSQ